MVDDKFIPLTGQFDMTEMMYRIQLGLANRKWAIHLEKLLWFLIYFKFSKRF